MTTHSRVVASQVVVAQRFLLEDGQGQVCAYLGLATSNADEPGPRLVLYDAEGKPRMGFRVLDRAAEFVLYGGHSYYEGPRAEFQSTKGGISLRVVDEDENAIWSAPTAT
jgi:hypothetical protein